MMTPSNSGSGPPRRSVRESVASNRLSRSFEL